jgi:cytochrome c oxidase subunit III
MSSDAHAHAHAHHFKSADHELESSKQGMWIFLLTEVLFFGGLFCAYGIFRALYPEMFKLGHHELDWRLGALNTVFLITSSLTMAMAVSACQKAQRTKAIVNLSLTFGLACGFLVVKFFEYSHKIHEGLLPGGLFTNAKLLAEIKGNPQLETLPLFFSIYFGATGLHGFHVICGMIVIAWLIMRAIRGDFNTGYFMPVEITGLYWHFVDLVWIFLFPMLYLVG